jgi:uncharacterized protein
MDLKRFYTTEQLSEHMHETPEGFLVCYDVPIARIGEYTYKSNEVPIEGGKDGLVKIQRDEAEVFNEETIKSFEGKPVTINHPNDFVTPQNWKDLAHGVMQNVRRGEKDQEDLLIADLCLTTEDAIRLVKAGLRQVSCGYDAQYDQIEPGLGKQKDIIGNHLALVVKGRAGNRCAIMDSECKCCGNCMSGKNILKKEGEPTMTKQKNGVKDVLRKIFPKLNLDHVKDEDLEIGEGTSAGSDVEVAQQAAAEAKEAAVQAVEAAKQASEAVQNVVAGNGNEPEAAPEPEPEAESLDDEEVGGSVAGGEAVSLETVNSKIDALASLVQELIDIIAGGDEEEGSEDAEGEENLEAEEEKIEDEGEEIPEEERETEDIYESGGIGQPKSMAQAEDEGENEGIAEEMSEEKSGLVTKDSIWRNVISKADVIAPGIVAPKPKSSNLKKVVSAVKRRALSEGLTKDHASSIKPLLRGRKIATLTEDALDTAFVAAFEMVRRANNAKLQKKTMQMKDLSSHSELAEMNRRNKEFWTKGNK